MLGPYLFLSLSLKRESLKKVKSNDHTKMHGENHQRLSPFDICDLAAFRGFEPSTFGLALWSEAIKFQILFPDAGKNHVRDFTPRDFLTPTYLEGIILPQVIFHFRTQFVLLCTHLI